MSILKKNGWILAGVAALLLAIAVVESRLFVTLIPVLGFLASRSGALLGKSFCVLSAFIIATQLLEHESVRERLKHLALTSNVVLMLLVSPFLVWKLWGAARSNIHEVQGRGMPAEREAE